MSTVYDFINECDCFYVLTMEGDFPSGRPFGAIMEYEDKLYISTNPKNKAHKQLRDNGNIVLIAKKNDSREWIRVKGKANECCDVLMKDKMLVCCPVLKKHFSSYLFFTRR